MHCHHMVNADHLLNYLTSVTTPPHLLLIPMHNYVIFIKLVKWLYFSHSSHILPACNSTCMCVRMTGCEMGVYKLLIK